MCAMVGDGIREINPHQSSGFMGYEKDKEKRGVPGGAVW